MSSINIYFDSSSGRIFLNNTEVGRLNYSERLVFELLVQERNKIVSKDALLAAGWPGRVVVPNSLNIAIKSIRGTLERAGIYNEPETVPKMGYKLSVDVISINNDTDIPRPTPSYDEPINSDIIKENDDTPSAFISKMDGDVENNVIHREAIRAWRFLGGHLYYIYVVSVFITSISIFFSRVISEPNFHCVEYNNSSFCGAHRIDRDDIPTEFLLDKNAGTYWFAENNNDFTFVKVD